MQHSEERIIRDISDGVIVLSSKGEITVINRAAQRLLGLNGDYSGKTYAQIIFEDIEANDEFHQVLIDAAGAKSVIQRKTIPYTCKNGEKICLEVTSSPIFDDEGHTQGNVLSFSDRTEEYTLQKKCESSSRLYVSFLCTLCIWNFITALWNYTGQPLSTSFMSKGMVFFVFVVVCLRFKWLGINIADTGIGFHHIKKAIITDSLITVVGLAIMIVIKLLLLKMGSDMFEEGAPLIVWSKYPFSEYVSYLISVVLQEYIARGIVHQSLKHIMPQKNINVTSIIVSSLIFGALHIHMGIIYMTSAAVLLGALGVLYNRQQSTWGLCIPHYILGMALGLLDFVAY